METPQTRSPSCAAAAESRGRAEIVNALTVDVEDYFQVSAFEPCIRRSQWGEYESRVVRNTHRILELLDRHAAGATFFVLGWQARRTPQLVREIQACGHAIGSHGYWHRLIYRQSPEEFRKDLRQSRGVLQDITGQPVTAYRAPSFSITEESLWALPILAEEGFQIDSSVFPIHHDRYGIPGAPHGLHRIVTEAGALWEFPPPVARIAGLSVPVGGGGYFRLYPLAWTTYCLRRINRRDAQPFLFYLHPWELDPEQPRIRVRSPLSRFRHYVHLATTEAKLVEVLRAFRFAGLHDVIERTRDSLAAGKTA
ncbi:MAG: XrtA system polysaccharide deacetylase [Thermoguttaceae bacterium]